MTTLYRHLTEGPVDTSVWPSSGEHDADGNLLYSFTGDTADGDAKGASDEWAVAEPVGAEPVGGETGEVDPIVGETDASTPAEPAAPGTTVDTPTDQVNVTPVDPPASTAPAAGEPGADQPQQGLAAAEANPAVGSSPASEAHAGTNVPDDTPETDPPARIVDGDVRGTDADLTTEEHVARFANNGSTDRETSNEDDQPEAYTPPPAGPGAPSAPQISSPGNGDTITSERLVITGVGDNGNLIYLEEGEGQFPVNPAVVSDGAFRFVISLEPGEHTLSVRQRNGAGDTSDPSEEVTVTVEATPDLDSIEDPDERFAHFLRQSILTAPRLGWDLFAELSAQANAWLEAKDK